MNAKYKKVQKLISKYTNIETAIRNCNGDPEMITMIKKITDRKDKEQISVKSFCDKLIENKLRSIAKALPDEGYSMGSIIRVTFNKITVTNDRTKEYSKSCKYRETYGSVKLSITKDELINTSIIGGLVTYIFPSKNKVKKCYWYDSKGQKQHFELKKVFGFIYEGFHATTKEKAFEGGKLNTERAKQAKKSAESFKKALRLQYSFSDSLKSGNCEAGTRAFALRLNLNIEKKYRGKYLLDLAKVKSQNSVYYIERMINYKAKG